MLKRSDRMVLSSLASDDNLRTWSTWQMSKLSIVSWQSYPFEKRKGFPTYRLHKTYIPIRKVEQSESRHSLFRCGCRRNWVTSFWHYLWAFFCIQSTNMAGRCLVSGVEVFWSLLMDEFLLTLDNTECSHSRMCFVYFHRVFLNSWTCGSCRLTGQTNQSKKRSIIFPTGERGN